MRVLSVSLLIVGVSLFNLAPAQSLRLDASKELTQFIHDSWEVDNGLPQNSVRALAQTSDGYIWVGTDDGLARFDGVSFTIYDKSNVASFGGGDAIRALQTDSSGVLWIGTLGSGLVKYQDGTFTHDEFIPAESISHISYDHAGRMWVGSWDEGLFVVDQLTVKQFSTETGLATNFVTTLFEDTEGTMWVGTREGLHYIEDESVHRFARNSSLTSPYITAIQKDSTGYLWVGTLDGLDRLSGSMVVGVPDGIALQSGVRTLYLDDSGVLWLGTAQDGLWRYDEKRFSSITTAGNMTSNRILSLLADREGSLLIGTEMGGLNRLRDAIFTPISTLENLSSDMAYALIEDRSGNMWIGTDGGGLNRISPDNIITTYTEQDGLTSNIIMSLENSSDGGLWIGTMGSGLTRYQNGRFLDYRNRVALPSPRIFALKESPSGELWIGTDGGLSRWANGNTTTYTVDDGLASNFITTLHIDTDGSIWAGTSDAGISIFQDGEFQIISASDGLASNSVLDLYQDENGDIWIGTSGGLSLYRDGAISSFSSNDGLPLDGILAIVEDDKDGLWFSSPGGIFTTKKRDINVFIQGESPKIASARFSKSQGLKSNEMNGGFQPAAWKGSDGRLWFPSGAGVAVVNPAATFHNTVAPPVVIEGSVADGNPVEIAGGATYVPGTKRIDINYSGLSFIEPEKMEYRYILNGYEVDWQNAGNARTATYTNLDPGSYYFQVIASNSDGIWNYTGASLNFTIQPFFYQTSWFYALCGVTLFIIGFMGYDVRVRQHKKREAELERIVENRTRDLRMEKEKTERQAQELLDLGKFKTRFFANVSHEFRTPLTMILGPLENTLNGSYGELTEGVQRQLEIMHRNSLRLMHLINELLDLQKIEAGKMQLQARPGNIAAFVEGILLSSSALAAQKNIFLEFDNATADQVIFYESAKLEKVFYNIISNALKFTPSGGSINVDITELPATPEMNEGAISISVSDTGPGIEEENLNKIFHRFTRLEGTQNSEYEGTGIGLALVKELVELHGGTISVASSVGIGTIFTITLPKGRQHLATSEIVAEEPLELQTLALDPAKEEGSYLHRSESSANFELPTKSHIENAPLVLVVDDNIDLCHYIAEILGSRYVIATAHDGEDGLAKARALLPNLIISDIQMPKMDGKILCSTVKQDELLRDTPVMLLTARSTNETTIDGFERGADDYMAKPFNARELIARSSNLIQLYSQKRALRDMNDQLGEMVQEQLDVILGERDAYEKSLLVAKERAESSERMKSTILDNISHEFRTPITVILGNLDIIAEEAPANLGPFVADIKLNSGRLLRTLDALLKFSELQSRSIEVHSTKFDLGQEIQQLAERFEPVAVVKGLEFGVEIPIEPLVIDGDVEIIDYAIDHIIDNAIKFTRDGSVELAVFKTGDVAEVVIRDTGIGIHEEFFPQMFAAFSQESFGTSRIYEGTGLGLALAKRLIDQVGGDIAVESTHGEGSVFRVVFPITTQREPDLPTYSDVIVPRYED